PSEDSEGLHRHHADVSGAGERGRPAEAPRIHQVAWCAAEWSAGALAGERRHPAAQRKKSMSSLTLHDVRFLEPEKTRNYLTVAYGAFPWLLTKDHKRIGILYMVSISLMFILGGFFAMMMRLELLTPEGDLLTSDTYNKFFTLHGIVMIFFFLIPSIPAVLGNFILPIQIGAKDLAFPKLNLLSWYLYMIGAFVGLLVIITGGVDTGWTFYTPFSTQYSNTHVLGTTFGAFIVGF